MTKTFKDMKTLSAHKAKQRKRSTAKRDVLNMLSRAYDATSQVLDLLDVNDYESATLSRDDLRFML